MVIEFSQICNNDENKRLKNFLVMFCEEKITHRWSRGRDGCACCRPYRWQDVRTRSDCLSRASPTLPPQSLDLSRSLSRLVRVPWLCWRSWNTCLWCPSLHVDFTRTPSTWLQGAHLRERFLYRRRRQPDMTSGIRWCYIGKLSVASWHSSHDGWVSDWVCAH